MTLSFMNGNSVLRQIRRVRTTQTSCFSQHFCPSTSAEGGQHQLTNILFYLCQKYFNFRVKFNWEIQFTKNRHHLPSQRTPFKQRKQDKSVWQDFEIFRLVQNLKSSSLPFTNRFNMSKIKLIGNNLWLTVLKKSYYDLRI